MYTGFKTDDDDDDDDSRRKIRCATRANQLALRGNLNEI